MASTPLPPPAPRRGGKINHLINNVLDENNIYSENLFIGGFSVGGNVALSYCIWYNKLNKKINKPLGIFVGDSPVDLYSLYNSQVKVIEENISNDVALEEGKFIINYLEEQIGNPRNSMDKYYKLSPFVDKEINKSNIKYLKDSLLELLQIIISETLKTKILSF